MSNITVTDIISITLALSLPHSLLDLKPTQLYQLDKYIIKSVVMSTTLMSVKGKIIILCLQEIVLAQYDNESRKDKGKEEDHSGGMSSIACGVEWWHLKEA